MFLCFYVFVLFNVVFLLLLKHKRTKLCGGSWPCYRAWYTPFPAQSECFVAVGRLLTLN